MIRRHTRAVAWLSVPLLALSACAAPGKPAQESSSPMAAAQISVTNCTKELTLSGPAKKLYVNDGNIIALTLAVGAREQITAVSSIGRDTPILTAKYGADVVAGLNDVSPEYPTMESILAASPDLVVAGWNYGFSEGKNLTPDLLADKGIPSYILTESCRQEGTEKRGLIDPWEAVRVDLTNLGALTGHSDEAKAVVDDLD